MFFFQSAFRQQWLYCQSSKPGLAVNAVVNVGVKLLVNAPVNAGRIVNAGLTFYCPAFFRSRVVSNWSQLTHKPFATRYCRRRQGLTKSPISQKSPVSRFTPASDQICLQFCGLLWSIYLISAPKPKTWNWNDRAPNIGKRKLNTDFFKLAWES